jgi:membrane protein involved in colicin uptake
MFDSRSGIGGETGWGVIFDEVQRVLTEMTNELDDHLARLVALKRVEAREVRKKQMADDVRRQQELQTEREKQRELEEIAAKRALDREKMKQDIRMQQQTETRRRSFSKSTRRGAVSTVPKT